MDDSLGRPKEGGSAFSANESTLIETKRQTWILGKTENGAVTKDKNGHLLNVDVNFDVLGELGDGPPCGGALVQVLAEALAALLGPKASTQTSRAMVEL